MYEKELYKFLKSTVFSEPLKIMLRENLDIEVVSFLLDNFKAYFMLNKELFIKAL